MPKSVKFNNAGFIKVEENVFVGESRYSWSIQHRIRFDIINQKLFAAFDVRDISGYVKKEWVRKFFKQIGKVVDGKIVLNHRFFHIRQGSLYTSYIVDAQEKIVYQEDFGYRLNYLFPVGLDGIYVFDFDDKVLVFNEKLEEVSSIALPTKFLYATDKFRLYGKIVEVAYFRNYQYWSRGHIKAVDVKKYEIDPINSNVILVEDKHLEFPEPGHCEPDSWKIEELLGWE
jgi:hypothetical protein